jgi:DNA-binding transcriptional LysR family regulator
LFIRTTRSVGLTEAGERFLLRAKPAFEELIAASAVARDLGQRPTGLLRLTVPRAVVPILLQPLIATFCQAYPDVQVEITASEELVDIAAQGFDARVRLGQFIAADMITVRLTPPFPFVVVGSPDYLPHAEATRTHRGSAPARVPASTPFEWVDRALVFCQRQQSGEVIVAGPIIANDFPTLLDAAIEGVGLAQVPEPVAAAMVKGGRLARVLERFAPTLPGLFLYYPRRRQIMPKLRAFIDHVKNRFDTGAGSGRPRKRG